MSRSSILLVVLVAALDRPARAESPTPEPIVVVPLDCTELWTLADPGSAASWSAMLSFAVCIQDDNVYQVDRADALPGFVEQLQSAIALSMHVYTVAIQEAPDDVKLRAAYLAALGQVAMITRARASLAAPELRDRLEKLLEPNAKLAYEIFTAIDRLAIDQPELVSDPVGREVVRSSRELATSLRRRWSRDERDELRVLR